MNNKQAIVLWIVVILLAATGLVPPWYQLTSNAFNGGVDTRICINYAPVFMAPKENFSQFDLPNPDPKAEDYDSQMRVKNATLKNLEKSIHIGIDIPRLSVEWGTLLLVGLGLFFLLADRKRRELAPKERMSYIERMKRAGMTAGEKPALDMALDDQDLTEDDAPTATDPKHVFSDDEL